MLQKCSWLYSFIEVDLVLKCQRSVREKPYIRRKGERKGIQLKHQQQNDQLKLQRPEGRENGEIYRNVLTPFFRPSI